MKLAVRQHYPCSPSRFWQMYWDDGFDAELQAGSTVDREVLSETREGSILVRRLKFVPQADLPGPVAAVVGGPKLVYEQLNRWDEASGVMTWEVLPSFLPASKFTAKGTLKANPVPSGCEMVVDGDITVKVMFIGGTIEKQVVGQIEDAYGRMHKLGLDWLKRAAAP
jgi:hypothetical protein